MINSSLRIFVFSIYFFHHFIWAESIFSKWRKFNFPGWSSQFVHFVSHSKIYKNPVVYYNFNLNYNPSSSVSSAEKKSCQPFCTNISFDYTHPLPEIERDESSFSFLMRASDPVLFGFGDVGLSLQYPLSSIFRVFVGTDLPSSRLSRRNHLLLSTFLGFSSVFEEEGYSIEISHFLSKYFYEYTALAGYVKWMIRHTLEVTANMGDVVHLTPSVEIYTVHDDIIYHFQNFRIRFLHPRSSIFMSYSWSKDSMRTLLRKSISNFSHGFGFTVGFSLSV